jgi:hypothetical protein
MSNLTAVTRTATSDLVINDFVLFSGERRQVVELADTGKPALFGTGTAWDITLMNEAGRCTEMVAAASDKWNRV